MKNIDLTNYNNFYKNAEELEALRSELYELANNKDWTYFYGLEEKEFNEFFETEGNAVYLRDDLSIEELIDFIEQGEDAYYGFWTFAEWNSKRKEFYERPQLHAFNTQKHREFQKAYAAAQNFEVPTDEEDEE